MSIDPSEILQSFREQLAPTEPTTTVEDNKALSEQTKTLINAVHKETTRKAVLIKARNARGKNKNNETDEV